MMFGKNKGIDAVVEAIQQDSIGIEIGVWRGDSSERLLTKAKFLHLVDPWSVTAYEHSGEFGDYQAYLDRYSELVGSQDAADFQRYYDDVYRSVVARFSGAPVEIHRLTSHKFFSQLDLTNRFDWVYIDGSHSYKGCLYDIRSSAMVTDTIFGDDYGVKTGVTHAVNDYCKAENRIMHYLGKGQYKIYAPV